MRRTLDTAATADIIPLAMARMWPAMADLTTDDNPVLEELIAEVTDYVEHRCDLRLRTETWSVWLDEDEIPASTVSDPLFLPLAPVASITSVKTYDDDGTESTVTSTNYHFRSGVHPRLTLTNGGTWGSAFRSAECMKITCVTGYGTDVVPYAAADTTVGGAILTLDDMRAALSDTWAGSARTIYEIKISTAATPDKFQWRAVTTDANAQKTYGAWSAETELTGAAQALENNLTVTFGATTGHAAGDAWTVQLYERIHPRLLEVMKAIIHHHYQSRGTGLIQTVSGTVLSVPRWTTGVLDSHRRQPL